MTSAQPSATPRFVVWFAIIPICMLSLSTSSADEIREWSDTTGNFKMSAKLIVVKGDTVYLETENGKTIKVPLNRLSEKDRSFLQETGSPFEEVADEKETKELQGKAETTTSNQSSKVWAENIKIDWDDSKELERDFTDEWKFEGIVQGDLGFTAKRSMLKPKQNFFEDIRRLEINPIAKRGVAGFTWSFSTPTPISRLALLDLPSGKVIHSENVEGDMCPLCLLNDGNTVVMFGTSRHGQNYEKSNQLQLWSMKSKKVERSAPWIPFSGSNVGRPNEDSEVVSAHSLKDGRLLLLSNRSEVVCIEPFSRKTYWHTRTGGHYAVDVSVDGSMIALLDGHAVMLIDPMLGKVVASKMLDDQPHMAWPRIRFSASGKRLLIGLMNQVRVLDLQSGTWLKELTFESDSPIAHGLASPHDDYALLNNSVLVHLPSKILVCEYSGAQCIQIVGNTSFIGIQTDERGLVVPSQIPHPPVEELLAKAQNDPNVFLIHPGVEVSIDASAAGQWANEVKPKLEQAVKRAGYSVVENSSISISATIAGPTPKAVSYFTAGSVIANEYTSTIAISSQGQEIWKRSGSNVPGMVSTSSGKSVQESVTEICKTPNMTIFDSTQFPRLLQNKSESNRSNALMTSQFTLTGVIDK